MSAGVVWRSVAEPRLERWERQKLWARARGFRLYVAVRDTGSIVATIEECRPPEHAVVSIAGRTWAHPTDSGRLRPEVVARAQRWAETQTRRLARVVGGAR